MATSEMLYSNAVAISIDCVVGTVIVEMWCPSRKTCTCKQSCCGYLRLAPAATELLWLSRVCDMEISKETATALTAVQRVDPQPILKKAL